MNINAEACLGEAVELAVKAIDQIEYVDLLCDGIDPDEEGEVVRQGGRFSQDVTLWIRERRNREALKSIVEGLGRKIRGNALAMRSLKWEEVELACDLVTRAIRGLIRAKSPGNAWVLRQRLIIKFSGFDAPWVQE